MKHLCAIENLRFRQLCRMPPCPLASATDKDLHLMDMRAVTDKDLHLTDMRAVLVHI